MPPVYLQYLRRRRVPLGGSLYLRVAPARLPSSPADVYYRPRNATERETHRLRIGALLAEAAPRAANGGAPPSEERRPMGRRRGAPCLLPNRLLRRIPCGGGGASALAFSQSGRVLAVAALHWPRIGPMAARAHPILLVDAGSGSCIQELDAHACAVRALSFSADDRLLVSGGADGTVIGWAIDQPERPEDTARPIARLCYRASAPPPETLRALALVPGAGSDRGTPGGTPHPHPPRAWVLTAGSSLRLLSLCPDLCCSIGALETGDSRRGHDAPITALCVDRRNGRVCSGDAAGEVLLWLRRRDGTRPEHYALLRRLRPRDVAPWAAPIGWLALRPLQEGRGRRAQLLVRAGGGGMRLVDLGSGAPVNPGYPGGTGGGTPPASGRRAASPRGQYVLAGTPEGTLGPWGRTGEGSPPASALGAAFSPDGQYVLAGTPEGTLGLWDAETGRRLALPPAGSDGTNVGWTREDAVAGGAAAAGIAVAAPIAALAWHPSAHVIAVAACGEGAAALTYFAEGTGEDFA